MTMRWSLLLALIAVSTMATAGAAHADPVNDESVTITMLDCTGPAGTPSSFDIAKIPNPGAGSPSREWNGNLRPVQGLRRDDRVVGVHHSGHGAQQPRAARHVQVRQPAQRPHLQGFGTDNA